MDHHGPAIGNLVFASVLAFVVPLLLNRFRRIRIPIAAGEILAGIIFGKSGLGLITPDPLLEIFNFLGLASLMFLSGMEIDPASLWGAPQRPENGRRAWLTRLYHPLGVGAVIFALSLFGAFQFTGWLERQGLVANAIFPAMIIATCGLTIIMPVLKDRALLNAPFGQAIFHTAVLGDILPLLGLSALVALRVKGSLTESLWILVLIAAAGLVFLFGKRVQRYNLLEGLTHGTAQIGVRAAFALMFIFLALAQSVGVETILGAFVAGLVLSSLASTGREEIAHKMDALAFGFLIPVFFLMVGVEFDVRSLLQDRQALVLVPTLFVGTLLVKAIPGLLLWIWFPLRTTFAGMLLLTTQMSVTIAASAIAHQVGAYGASTHAAVVLVAIMTAMIGPVAFGKILGDQPGTAERKAVILAGMNRLSLLLGGRLAAGGVPVSAIDRHPDRVREFEAAGIRAIGGDPASVEGLEQAGAKQARAVVAITQDEEENLAATLAARRSFDVPRAILFASSSRVAAQAREERLEVINPDLAEVALVESLLESPAAASLLTGQDGDLSLHDFVLVGGPLIGRSLREANLPAAVLVVAILRGREKIVPHGSTILRSGDVLTAVGPPEAWEEMRRLTQGL